MSYYEDVYLTRVNKYGTTRQERILGAKQAKFDYFLANKSVYKVDFIFNYHTYSGALEPGKGDEKDILSYMLISKEVVFNTGNVLKVNNDDWLVVHCDVSPMKGYNKYTVYLLDRTVTWWDEDNQVRTAKANFNSSLRANVQVSYSEKSGAPLFREDVNKASLLMPFNAYLKAGNYLKLDTGERRFIVVGFDIETVPGVQYVTLDISLRRDDDEQSVIPDSYWTGGT